MKWVLHVGCGSHWPGKFESSWDPVEWRELRLDIDPRMAPDIVADMRAVPLEDDSVDAVWSMHNLEHLAVHEVVPCLQEWRRVLKPAGFVMLAMPDIQAVAEWMVLGPHGLLDTAYTTPAGFDITPLDMLYGFGPSVALGQLPMRHRTGFTLETLTSALFQAGFREVWVQRQTMFELWAVALLERQTVERTAAPFLPFSDGP